MMMLMHVAKIERERDRGDSVIVRYPGLRKVIENHLLLYTQTTIMIRNSRRPGVVVRIGSPP